MKKKNQNSKKSSKASKMKKTEREFYKRVLLEEKKKMMGEFLRLKTNVLNKSQKEASGDLSGYSYHLADMASDVYETDFLLRLAGDERERLYSIDEALKRIEEGNYGLCSTCSKPIPKKRLKAIPQTANCLDCQKIQEA